MQMSWAKLARGTEWPFGELDLVSMDPLLRCPFLQGHLVAQVCLEKDGHVNGLSRAHMARSGHFGSPLCLLQGG